MRELGEGVSKAGVAVVMVAIVLFGWIGWELRQWPPAPQSDPSADTTAANDDAERARGSRVRDEASSAPSEPADPTSSLRVALIGDGLTVAEGSWFERTIAAGAIEGLAPGVNTAEAGLDATEMQARVARTAKADVVVVQGGTIDLLEFSSAEATATALETLLQSVVDLGGAAGGPAMVWVPVPPLDAQPADILTINERVSAFAQERGITVWDLTTPVATPTGAWKPGLSAEGIAPNAAGQAAQARAAMAAAEKTVTELAGA